MKQYLLLLVLFVSFGLVSCGGDGKDEPTPPEPEKEISVVGVWESGDYFVSFSSDNYYCAYLPDNYIDDGGYTYNKTAKTITCTNLYFNRNETVFKVQSISDKSINVNVTYVDSYGQTKTKTLSFSKSTKAPTPVSHKLMGRSMSYTSTTFGTVSMKFNSNNAGVRSCSKGSAAKYPLNFYYIFKSGDNKLYYQLIQDTNRQVPTIGAWTLYDKLFCWELIFESSGNIDFNQIFP